MWQFFWILSILTVQSQISFFETSVNNRRQFKVEISCTGIPFELDRAGGFLDTAVIPLCISRGMWLELPDKGWVWGDWQHPMELTVPGYQCILKAADTKQLERLYIVGHSPSDTEILCCWGPWCNPLAPARRELNSIPNGEDYCESEHMLRNAHGCQQSSCCHWNTWEAGSASFNGQGRCWSSIGRQTCTDRHVSVGLQECHDEPSFWYDSDGPYYNCHWYRQDRRRCAWYGNYYRNFGKTANEACCGCRHTHGRRELGEIEGEDIIPKQGFLHTNEIASGFNVENSEMVATEGITSTADKCQERSWWDSASPHYPTLECSTGEAIGAFYKTNVLATETFSVEKGYCCAIDASAECTFKQVSKSAETMTCDEGYVLSGFKMDDEGYLFSDVEEIKCCKL